MTIHRLEAILDRTFLMKPLPHQNRVLATWYYLTASEDFQRNLFSSMGAEFSSSRIIFYLDKNKYALRYSLDRIAKECRNFDWAPVPRRAVPKLYTIAGHLMHAGVDYALASRLWAALHAGTAIATEGADAWQVELDEAHHDKAYAALEALYTGVATAVDFAAVLFHWIRTPATAPDVVGRIANSVRCRNGLVTYKYSQNFAVELAHHLPQPHHLIPATWKFSWGSRRESTLLINALSIRCIYHLVAVHFGAQFRSQKGGGESNIVLVISLTQLIVDLELMTSLGRDQIQLFVRHLTWGVCTKTPDPALQPLLPLGSGMVALPCIHWLSSSHERNLMSLMARTQQREFDGQSKLFEIDMVEALLSSRAPPHVAARANILLRHEGIEEEIDLLLIDEQNKRLLVCELRWMLGPSDPREVQNRKKVCIEKVAQVRRKAKWVSLRAGAHAAAALSRRVVSEECSSGWVTNGIVVIAGFGGTRSSDPCYPIIPVEIFTRAMAKAPTLEALALWCRGLTWLPQEGKHFTTETMDIEIDHAKSLTIQGMEIPDSAGRFMSEVVNDL